MLQRTSLKKHTINILWLNSSSIRQNGESQNGCHKKTKHANFFKKPEHKHVCASGGKKCLFFGKFGLLCFFCNTLFWDWNLCLITDELRQQQQQNIESNFENILPAKSPAKSGLNHKSRTANVERISTTKHPNNNSLPSN